MADTDLMTFAGELIAKWGFVGAVVGILLAYPKQVLGIFSRQTRDPLIESLGAQNGHFEENNRLFKAMGPVLGSMDHTLKAILKEQESQTRALHELAADSRIILDRGKR